MKKLFILACLAFLIADVQAQVKVTNGEIKKRSPEQIEKLIPPMERKSSTKAGSVDISSTKSYHTSFEGNSLPGWTPDPVPSKWTLFPETLFCDAGLGIVAFEGVNILGIMHGNTLNSVEPHTIYSPIFNLTEDGDYTLRFRYRTFFPGAFEVAIFNGETHKILGWVNLYDENDDNIDPNIGEFNVPDWFTGFANIKRADLSSFYLGFGSWETGEANSFFIDSLAVLKKTTVELPIERLLTVEMYPPGAGVIGNDDDGFVQEYFTLSYEVDLWASYPIEAIAGEGYIFSHWAICGSNTEDFFSRNSNIEYFVSAENRTLTAVFTSCDKVKLTVSSNNINWGTVTGSGCYAEGSEITVTADPKSDYRFVGWYINDVLQSTSAYYNFTIPATDVELEGRFEFFTGIQESEISNINVYPNPITDVLTIQTDRSYDITVTDISGRVMLQQKLNSENSVIDFSNYQSGMYFIQFKNASETKTIKVSKIQ
jgi:hypothetical protein